MEGSAEPESTPLPRQHVPQSSLAYGPEGAYAKFLSWTNEKVRLTEALDLEVEPTYTTMLDVGAGDGSITRPLSERFESTIALEPSGEFVDPPASVHVLAERVEQFLADNPSRFDFILASHVFIYVPEPTQVVAQLIQRVNEGGRFAIVMLEGESQYQQFVTAFAGEVNPALRDRSTYKSRHLMADLQSLGCRWRRNQLTTSLIAPSIDEFLSINKMHFNYASEAIEPGLLQQMHEHLSHHINDDGLLELDLQHGIYVVER